MKVLPKVTVLPLLLGTTLNTQANEGVDPTKPMMTKLKEGVYQYSQFFYNSLVVITNEGVIVTDPSGTVRSKMMLQKIRKLTDMPVKKVIYSHDHFDHSRGGQIFKDEGAEFIAQEKCTELLSRDLRGQVVQPDVTYNTDMSIRLGEKQVDLHYYGLNDGESMSVIHMPEDKVLLGVDRHLPGYVNESNRLTTHNYVAVVKTFERVMDELEFDTVLSGYMPASSSEGLREDYRFNKALFEAVWKGMQKRKTTEELKKSIKLPEFSHWGRYEENLSACVERMSYSIWHGN